MDGAIIGTIGVAIDISDRKSLEEELRQSQKMEAIGRLAGGIAHDFNNLLTSILGGSSLVLDRLDSGVGGGAGRGGPLPRRDRGDPGGRRARRRADPAVAGVQPPSGRGAARPRPEHDRSSNTARMLERLLGEEIRLELAFDPALAPVRADEGQIHQVLINLAVNARDAMPEGGTIRIATANIEVGGAREGDADGRPPPSADIPAGRYSVITVSDSGVGMDDWTRAHIFEPFFTTKEKGKGTGLGLATVYGIVTQSGGQVTAESSAGRGSTFRVYLPSLPSGVSVSATTHEPTGAGGRGETVLLVEDEGAVRDLVATALQDRGYTLLTAADAEEALELDRIHAGPIDLLITDVVMRGMRGPELARRIRERRPELPVLFMSGYPDDALNVGGDLDSGTAFLQKPFRVRALGAKVAEVLRAARPLPEAG